MSDRTSLILLAALGAAGALVALGHVERNVSLDSVGEIWADTLRDIDQASLRAVRITAAEEMRLGAMLARQFSSGYREDPVDTAYVSAVGTSLARHARRQDMRYSFHVIEDTQINAFAFPGGHIYVTRGMMDFLRTEAELASVLGHEISHVDLRHSVSRVKYRLLLERVDAGGIGEAVDAVRTLTRMAYDQAQESEADAHGTVIAARDGYEPAAAEAVHRRLAAPGAGAPRTPVGEIGRATGGLLSSYFESHPPSAQRADRLGKLAGSWKGKRLYYRGASNYANRSVVRRAEEWIRY
ncbi:MAG: hypothetical protein FJW39_29705 [Acidobacteria bacterium]|nr:hypothetical protein [Acidobacteriota bacterium]